MGCQSHISEFHSVCRHHDVWLRHQQFSVQLYVTNNNTLEYQNDDKSFRLGRECIERIQNAPIIE